MSQNRMETSRRGTRLRLAAPPTSATAGSPEKLNEESEKSPYECPDCQDVGTRSVIDGEYLGRPHFAAKTCECRLRKIYRERFLQAVDRTPLEDFGWITNGIASFVPDDSIHPKQSEVLKFIKENPLESLYFFGITGSGKSSFAWATWQDSAKHGYVLEAKKGTELIKAFRDAEFGRFTGAKLFSLEQLAKGEKWCVLIDEFDKIKLTEYSLATLFNILATLKSYGHRILITAKKSLADVENEWLAKDVDGRFDAENYAADIRRRMVSKCVPVDLRLADCNCGNISAVTKLRFDQPVCAFCGDFLTNWRRY